MPPKIIHLCWFSKDPYPLEIKICLASWKCVLPDYTVRVWTYEDAKAIGCKYIDQALSVRKWAFAADVVRFYAVYKEGGVYMDSDIYLRKRFDRFIPETGCATFNERWEEGETDYGIQAAFFIGSKGNDFCKEVFEYYQTRDFIRPDGSLDQTVSPYIMRSIAERRGYVCKEEEQHLEGIDIYPTHWLSPRSHFKHSPDAFGEHRVYGSWRNHKFGRKLERSFKHFCNAVKFYLLGR